MGNPSQTDKTAKTGSGRNQQQGKPPTERPIADDAGRFTREPAEGGRESADQDGAQADTPANGGARGKNVKNH